MARRRSVSGLEAETELTGLDVPPKSTSDPSGTLLEQQDKEQKEKTRQSILIFVNTHTI